jgi:hypothetical protein
VEWEPEEEVMGEVKGDCFYAYVYVYTDAYVYACPYADATHEDTSLCLYVSKHVCMCVCVCVCICLSIHPSVVVITLLNEQK